MGFPCIYFYHILSYNLFTLKILNNLQFQLVLYRLGDLLRKIVETLEIETKLEYLKIVLYRTFLFLLSGYILFLILLLKVVKLDFNMYLVPTHSHKCWPYKLPTLYLTHMQMYSTLLLTYWNSEFHTERDERSESQSSLRWIDKGGVQRWLSTRGYCAVEITGCALYLPGSVWLINEHNLKDLDSQLTTGGFRTRASYLLLAYRVLFGVMLV